MIPLPDPHGRSQALTGAAARPGHDGPVPSARRPRALRDLLAEVGRERAALGQGLSALMLNSSTSLVAGAFLGALTGTFEEIGGLLILVPAAIGLRGNVFSAFGSRLSTARHLGTLQFTTRSSSVLGRNITASMALTLGTSVVLAAIASLVATASDVVVPAPVAELALVSVLGGLLASMVVLGAAILLAVGAVRFAWDLDNLVAPLVSTLGDVLTLPALWLATLLIGRGPSTEVAGWVLIVGSVAACAAVAVRRDEAGAIVRQSLPVLIGAGFLSSLAGVVIESRLASFAAMPALLILYPAFVSSAGAIGGLLSSRLATKLHMGIVAARFLPGRIARLDATLAMSLVVPVCIVNGLGTQLVTTLTGTAGPGVLDLVLSSLVAGVPLGLFVVAVAHLGTVAAVRFELDPDTYGVPLVTSSVDLVGAFFLVLTFSAFGLAS